MWKTTRERQSKCTWALGTREVRTDVLSEETRRSRQEMLRITLLLNGCSLEEIEPRVKERASRQRLTAIERAVKLVAREGGQDIR